MCLYIYYIYSSFLQPSVKEESDICRTKNPVLDKTNRRIRNCVVLVLFLSPSFTVYFFNYSTGPDVSVRVVCPERVTTRETGQDRDIKVI